jgi:hypothetical protein
MADEKFTSADNSSIAGGIEALDKVADEMEQEGDAEEVDVDLDGAADVAGDEGDAADDAAADDVDLDEEGEGDAEDDELDEDDIEDEDDEAAADGDAAKSEAADEDAPAALRRDDGAEWNAESGRWVKDGKFVAGAAPTAEQLATLQKPAADGAAAAAAWEPLAVKVGRQQFTVPEAQVMMKKGSDGKDYAFLAVPKEQLDRFQARIGRGVQAEKMSRELEARIREVQDMKTELDEEYKAPPAGAIWDLGAGTWRDAKGAAVAGRAPTDAEIESMVFMAALRGEGPYANKEGFAAKLHEVFEPWQIELMERDVKLAQRSARDYQAKYSQDRRTEREHAATVGQEEEKGMADTIVEIAEAYPEFKDLSDDDLKAVFTALKPYQRAIFWREGNEYFRNTEQVYGALKQKAAEVASRPAPQAAPGKGQPAKATAAPSRDERFNQGQRTAAQPTKPGTTSLSARRDGTKRPDPKSPTRKERREQKRQRRLSPEARAEVRHRQDVRKFMSSPDLDFPG